MVCAKYIGGNGILLCRLHRPNMGAYKNLSCGMKNYGRSSKGLGMSSLKQTLMFSER
jgi:hypothetical protein